MEFVEFTFSLNSHFQLKTRERGQRGQPERLWQLGQPEGPGQHGQPYRPGQLGQPDRPGQLGQPESVASLASQRGQASLASQTGQASLASQRGQGSMANQTGQASLASQTTYVASTHACKRGRPVKRRIHIQSIETGAAWTHSETKVRRRLDAIKKGNKYQNACYGRGQAKLIYDRFSNARCPPWWTSTRSSK